MALHQALLRGVAQAAAGANCSVVGGDLTAVDGATVLTVTALGEPAGRLLLRSNARVGDCLHVTGPLGGAELGHHLRFTPALAEGRWLAAQRGIGAVIDVSDGLLRDLDRVLQASGSLGAELEAAAVPITGAAKRLARTTGQPALWHALGDGEDHVLLFTVRAGVRLAGGGPLSRAARQPIGRVTQAAGLRLRHSDGSIEPLAARGYRHRWSQ